MMQKRRPSSETNSVKSMRKDFTAQTLFDKCSPDHSDRCFAANMETKSKSNNSRIITSVRDAKIGV